MVVYSLAMVVSFIGDGSVGYYQVQAPWLKEPVLAPTFEEAYEQAMKGRQGHEV